MNAAPKLNSHDIAERLDELPTLPAVVYELSRVINDPMSSTKEIENVMANDQSLTAKVLMLANSAYYAIPGGVMSLQRAIGYIGFDTINQLVLSASIIKALSAKASLYFEPSQFWKHSLGVAMASETVAKACGHPNPPDLFTCGLVHDMGKIALYILTPHEFNETLQLAHEKHSTFSEAEALLGQSPHNLIGRDLAVRWLLPPMIQACVAFHHEKDIEARGKLSPELNRNVDIVYLANLLVHALQYGSSGHSKVLGVPKELLERRNLDSAKLKMIIDQLKVTITSADGFLKIIGG